ncbi:MAG: ribokinase [Chloroflexi bacterium]|nr:ribokinase [Chloroflexota bacterium]
MRQAGSGERPTIVVLGGINMDIFAVAPRLPETGETVVGSRYFITPGGKGANQAVACARLGALCRMVGRVGADAFGHELLDSMARAGVDVSGVAEDTEHASGVAILDVEETTGQNRIIQVPGANWATGPEDAARAVAAMEGAHALMLQLEVPPQVSLEVARQAHARGCWVVLDPAPARPFPLEMWRYLHVMTPNETEAEPLVGLPVTGLQEARAAARDLRLGGAPAAVVKLGEKGAAWADRHGEGILPAYPVRAVDTVGAGDAFNAGLAVALAEGRPMQEALRWAMAAGALAVTRPGAQEAMPTRAEVEALLGGGGLPRH